ncbi:ubiquinone biosynthesis monooxygenase Coq7 [Thiogranum longum]|uniref:3-demethoxyubiquinol 3-hydroxylase n=1 Tax=Thiogranum longum TaxID=1537524 RepID=A0A4R1HD78_9GAMM|nr:2-polyprenyl-3-methyl-6-methoxy-1,4-benzoquinone monooxygenase [Thiogranum longum]TCK17209.1 ubiquinone biosynthesis monooxygenase Coq7 [Thiogranum longum]
MMTRHYTPLDQLVMNFDQALRTLAGRPLVTERPDPAEGVGEGELSEAEKTESMRLMRVNHSGEVAAQALYQGQALTAKLPEVRERMERAAAEENDHLAWCEKRVHALDGHLSYLNPLWYAGSFAIGATAGLAGDKWSLGFVAETECQVIEHLDEHLKKISPKDRKSRAVLEQMKVDEAHHGELAKAAGGVELPAPVKALMGVTSRIMTGMAYWL